MGSAAGSGAEEGGDAEAMSPRLVCALERFKGRAGKPECQKAFRQNRPWQKCCCRRHQKRFDYLEEKRLAGRRRKARGRAQRLSNAPRAHFTRIRSRRYVEVGSVGKGLELAARLNPKFLLRLAASIPKPEQAAT